MSHSISIRLGHSVIPEADTFTQLILSIFFFCALSFVSESSAWKQMNGTTRDDGWSVAFIIITIVSNVMAASSPSRKTPRPSTASLRRRPSFGMNVIFFFFLLDRVEVYHTHFPMMRYNRLTYHIVRRL
jgi:hypothetical protein